MIELLDFLLLEAADGGTTFELLSATDGLLLIDLVFYWLDRVCFKCKGVEAVPFTLPTLLIWPLYCCFPELAASCFSILALVKFVTFGEVLYSCANLLVR